MFSIRNRYNPVPKTHERYRRFPRTAQTSFLRFSVHQRYTSLIIITYPFIPLLSVKYLLMAVKPRKFVVKVCNLK